jgi:rod shape-determining protein MreB
MLVSRIAIDLGTTTTRMIVPKRGVVLDQPSVVARDTAKGTVLAIGQEALEMIGRTPEAIEAYYPLRSGVIADFRVTERMLEHYLGKSMGRLKLRRPEAIITVSAGATSTERRAVQDVAQDAGLRRVHLIESPVAAALGAGVPVSLPTGNMVIDIGGGTTEIAVMSLGGIVSQSTVRIGGHDIDEAIIDFLRRSHSLAIGRKTAEEVKQLAGSAMPQDKRQQYKIKGRDLVGGLPKTITISPNELVPIIENVIEKIVFSVRNTIEQSPPELVSDIIEHGIVLTGGMAQLSLLDRLLSKVIGVPVIISQDPALASVKGAYQALVHLDDHRRLVVSS